MKRRISFTLKDDRLTFSNGRGSFSIPVVRPSERDDGTASTEQHNEHGRRRRLTFREWAEWVEQLDC